MDNSTQITEEVKTLIYNSLGDAMLAGLETNTLTLEESQISSKYILDNLDTLTTQDQLLSFLESISNMWYAYKSVYLMIKEQESQQQDDMQLEETRHKLELIPSQ